MESEARDCSSCHYFQDGSSLLVNEKLVSDHFQLFDFLLRQYKLYLIDIFASGKLFCKRMEKIYNYTTLRLLSSWEKHFSNHLRRSPHSNCKCCATIVVSFAFWPGNNIESHPTIFCLRSNEGSLYFLHGFKLLEWGNVFKCMFIAIEQFKDRRASKWTN